MKQHLLIKTMFVLMAMLMVGTKMQAQEPYAALNENKTVLTFYYDDQKEARGGMDVGPFGYGTGKYYPDWWRSRATITSVVFDDTFANCTTITSTASWFIELKNLESVTGLANLNTSNVTNMKSMFTNCSALTTLDLSTCSTTQPADMSEMFYGCTALTNVAMGNIKTSVMNWMFLNCRSLLNVDLSGINTSEATNMNNMFGGCTMLEKLDLSNFNTQKVTDMGHMFQDCNALVSLDISCFNTSGVTYMAGMFTNCSHLSKLDLSHFDTSNVTTLEQLFSGCTSLTDINLVNFKTSMVKNMSTMFRNCSSLSAVDLSNFETSNVTDMHEMFSGCSALETLDLSCFNTSEVINMGAMFSDCINLTTIYAGEDWTIEKVQNKERNGMFYNCNSLVGGNGTTFISYQTGASYAHIDGELGQQDSRGYLTASKNAKVAYAVPSADHKTLTFYYDSLKEQHSSEPLWEVGSNEGFTKVVIDDSFSDFGRLYSTANWFYNAYDVTTIEGLQNLNTTKVTDMGHMFYGCARLTSLDLSSFNTEKVTNMVGMFGNCARLTSLDLSSLNTENVKYMLGMFGGCSSLTSLDLRHFSTSNVTEMGTMFNDCYELVSLDLSSFDTKNVTSMGGMFRNCYSLVSLDLSSFNTSNVSYVDQMFYMESDDASSLQTIYVGEGWNTEKLTEGYELFTHCKKLVGQHGTVYDADHTDYTYAHVDGGETDPGYLTSVALPYALLSEDNKVLTFYYDQNMRSRKGMGVGPFDDYTQRGWNGVAESIEEVVFDVSFADCTTLTSTALWFRNFKALATIKGMENLRSDNVTNMSSMFLYCSSLTSLDLSSFNTENVTDMSGMFFWCTTLTSLDLSSFNTSNVKIMASMFRNCNNLHTIYVSDLWSTKGLSLDENYRAGYYLFSDCYALKGGKGTTYDAYHTDHTYARIDGGEEAPGYLTYKATTGMKGVTRNADLQHAPVYNLGGQQLTAPQRGINIIGGKKVVLK